MEQYQERVMSEAEELGTKIRKLVHFTKTFAFSQLLSIEQDVLKRQLSAMTEYLFILNTRIWRWTGR